MMTKFHMEPENCTFVVDKENKRVICYVEHTKRMFIDYLNGNSRIGSRMDEEFCYNHDIKFGSNFEKKLEMPNKFFAIAKCNPDDAWDEDVGRVVAFSKLKDKVIKSFFKRAKTYFDFTEKALDTFEYKLSTLQSDLHINQIKRNEYIKSITAR